MLVGRFLDGLAGSAFLSVAGGTVGDMFAKHVSWDLPRLLYQFGLVVHELMQAGTVGTHDGVYCESFCGSGE